MALKFCRKEPVVNPTQKSKSKSKSDSQQQGPSPERNSWALASVGMQLVVTLLVCVYLGYKADQIWSTSPWMIVLGSIVGILVALYQAVIR